MAKPILWGVLGAAGIAMGVVIPAMQQSRLGRVVALGSRNAAKAAGPARDLGIDRVYGSYEAVLADPDVDAIYIPLPNSMHAEWVERSAAAGKHVLCEKPLALSAAEARCAAAACASHGVTLMEGFMYRFHPQQARLRDLLAAGTIGEVKEAHTHLSVDIMSPPDPANVRFAPALGGGALYDMGCYTVSAARMIFGAEPQRVLARAAIDPQFRIDRHVHGILEFEHGTAVMSCGFDSHGQGRFSIVGSQGVIEVPRAIIPGLGTRAAETLIIIVDADGNRREERLAPVNQYGLMADAFCEAVLNGRAVPLAPADSIRNMAVLDALFRSLGSGGFEAVET